MAKEGDDAEFLALFPDARRLERSLALRNFRAGRQQFDRETPAQPDENCRKAMKLAFFAAAASWLRVAAIVVVPGAALLSFHSSVLVDVLAALFLVPATATFAMAMSRFHRAQVVYPGRVRASWAGFYPPLKD